MSLPQKNPLHGLSLPEMAAIMLLLAAITLVMVPRFISSRITTNEESAIAFLRQISGAEEHFLIQNGGRGFAFLSELLAVGERRPEFSGLPAQLEGRGAAWARGVLTLGGYNYVVYLADNRGRPLARPESNSPTAIKRFWVAYAWPTIYGRTGRKVFAVDQNSLVWTYQNASHPLSGPLAAPPANLLAARIARKENPFRAPGEAQPQLHWEPVPGS